MLWTSTSQKKISQFAELKTLTEDVGGNESVISSVFCKAAEWRKTDRWREGEVKRQRTTNAKRRETNIELEQKEQTEKRRTT